MIIYYYSRVESWQENNVKKHISTVYLIYAVLYDLRWSLTDEQKQSFSSRLNRKEPKDLFST